MMPECIHVPHRPPTIRSMRLADIERLMATTIAFSSDCQDCLYTNIEMATTTPVQSVSTSCEGPLSMPSPNTVMQ